MIPKKIWQTYKTDAKDLPESIQIVRNTWIDRNPDWQYNYMSDSDMMDFVNDHYGKKWVDLFNSCPIPVMKADIWRIIVLYSYGGIYADIDTICNVPLSSWFDKLSGKKMIVAAEHELHLEQWAFLSEANNPILEKIILNIEMALMDSGNYKNPNFVHHMTGPLMFTKSILEYIELWKKVDYPPTGNFTFFQNDGAMSKESYHSLNLIKDVNKINESDGAKKAAFYIIPQYMSFEKGVISHLFGSINWNDSVYGKWLKDRDAFLNNI